MAYDDDWSGWKRQFHHDDDDSWDGDDDGYENYIRTTVDPGPWLFWGTVAVVISLFLCILPLVWTGRKWKKYRKARKRAKKAAANDGKIEHPYEQMDDEDEFKDAVLIEMPETSYQQMSESKVPDTSPSATIPTDFPPLPMHPKPDTQATNQGSSNTGPLFFQTPRPSAFQPAPTMMATTPTTEQIPSLSSVSGTHSVTAAPLAHSAPYGESVPENKTEPLEIASDDNETESWHECVSLGVTSLPDSLHSDKSQKSESPNDVEELESVHAVESENKAEGHETTENDNVVTTSLDTSPSQELPEVMPSLLDETQGGNQIEVTEIDHISEIAQDRSAISTGLYQTENELGGAESNPISGESATEPETQSDGTASLSSPPVQALEPMTTGDEENEKSNLSSVKEAPEPDTDAKQEMDSSSSSPVDTEQEEEQTEVAPVASAGSSSSTVDESHAKDTASGAALSNEATIEQTEKPSELVAENEADEKSMNTSAAPVDSHEKTTDSVPEERGDEKDTDTDATPVDSHEATRALVTENEAEKKDADANATAVDSQILPEGNTETNEKDTDYKTGETEDDEITNETDMGSKAGDSKRASDKDEESKEKDTNLSCTTPMDSNAALGEDSEHEKDTNQTHSSKTPVESIAAPCQDEESGHKVAEPADMTPIDTQTVPEEESEKNQDKQDSEAARVDSTAGSDEGAEEKEGDAEDVDTSVGDLKRASDTNKDTKDSDAAPEDMQPASGEERETDEGDATREWKSTPDEDVDTKDDGERLSSSNTEVINANPNTGLPCGFVQSTETDSREAETTDNSGKDENLNMQAVAEGAAAGSTAPVEADWAVVPRDIIERNRSWSDTDSFATPDEHRSGTTDASHPVASTGSIFGNQPTFSSFPAPSFVVPPANPFVFEKMSSPKTQKASRKAAELFLQEQQQRDLQYDVVLRTMDRFLDPYSFEDDQLRVTGVVSHFTEDGTPDSNQIELFETTALSQRPFGQKGTGFPGRKPGAGRPFPIIPDLLDTIEEEDVPDDVAVQYYDAGDEPGGDSDDEGDEPLPSDFESFARQTTRGWDTFASVLSCDKEARKILSLAFPATFSSISSAFIDAISTALIAKHIGPEGFTAYSMVGVFLGLTDSLISGIGEAEGILTPQAIGMQNSFLAGQYAQISVVLYVLFAIPTYGAWMFLADEVILLYGLGDTIAELTRLYMPIAVFSYLINGVADGLSTLLWSSGHGVWMTVTDSIFSVIYVAVIGFATFFLGNDMTLNTVGWIGIGYGAIYGLFVFLATKCLGYLEPYWKGLVKKVALRNFSLVKGILKMALPLSFGTVMAEGEWQIMTFFAATMGGAEVAAWYIAGAIWSVFEYAPGGIAYAAEIRIAYHLGNHNPRLAKLAAYKSLFYSALWSTIVTIMFFIFSPEIIRLFTNDATLIVMLEEIVPLMAVGNVLCCLGNDAYSIISAQSRPKLCTRIYFVATWFVVLPLAGYLVLYQNYGLPAIIASVVVAYGLVAVCFLYVVFTSNWSKISEKVIAKVKAMEEDSESESSDVQEAAGLV